MRRQRHLGKSSFLGEAWESIRCRWGIKKCAARKEASFVLGAITCKKTRTAFKVTRPTGIEKLFHPNIASNKQFGAAARCRCSRCELHEGKVVIKMRTKGVSLRVKKFPHPHSHLHRARFLSFGNCQSENKKRLPQGPNSSTLGLNGSRRP